MSSANAGYWSHTPTYGGGWKSEYTPSYGYQGNNQWGWK